jgi:hypothetical protein
VSFAIGSLTSMVLLQNNLLNKGTKIPSAALSMLLQLLLKLTPFNRYLVVYNLSFVRLFPDWIS